MSEPITRTEFLDLKRTMKEIKALLQDMAPKKERTKYVKLDVAAQMTGLSKEQVRCRREKVLADNPESTIAKKLKSGRYMYNVTELLKAA